MNFSKEAVKAVATIIKTKFPNQSVEQTLDISYEILEAIATIEQDLLLKGTFPKPIDEGIYKK